MKILLFAFTCLPWASATFKPSKNLVVLHILPRSCHQGSCLAVVPRGPYKRVQQTAFSLAQGSRHWNTSVPGACTMVLHSQEECSQPCQWVRSQHTAFKTILPHQWSTWPP